MAGALCRKTNHKAEAQRGMGRRDDMKINRAFTHDLGVMAEEMQPDRWKQRHGEADSAGEEEPDGAADPADLARARNWPAPMLTPTMVSVAVLTRVDFEAAWRVFLSKRTEADFQEWRDDRDWTAEKYRCFDRGERMPP